MLVATAIQHPLPCIRLSQLQGVSRSATLVIAYLMWKTGKTYDEVFARVKAIRCGTQFCRKWLSMQYFVVAAQGMLTRTVMESVGPVLSKDCPWHLSDMC